MQSRTEDPSREAVTAEPGAEGQRCSPSVCHKPGVSCSQKEAGDWEFADLSSSGSWALSPAGGFTALSNCLFWECPWWGVQVRLRWPWRGPHLQRAATRSKALLLCLLLVRSPARRRQGRARQNAQSLPGLGTMFAQSSAIPAVAPGAKLDTG